MSTHTNTKKKRPAASRRKFLGTMLGALPLAGRRLSAAEAPLRLAISESLVADVNMADARASMAFWLKQMTSDLQMPIEFNPQVFDTTAEIVTRARAGRLDAAALNIFEYRQLVDVLDPNQVISEGGAVGQEQYVVLTKRSSGFDQLKDLRGRRLCVLKGPKLCASTPWLTTILEEARLGPSDQFFGTITTETKVSRAILPVFFGQADACLAPKRGFDMMGELNPQVAKSLSVVANSPPLTVAFYVFRKDYRGINRERFIRILSNLRSSPAGKQLSTLFQFEQLTVRDAKCLANSLEILETADRITARNKKRSAGTSRS